MPKSRSPLISVVMVFAAAMTAAAALCAPAAFSAKSPVKKCAPVATGGHVYYVSTTHAACTLADKWVGALAAKRLAAHSSNVPLPNGPKGFTCQAGTKPASADMPDIPANVQVSGNCAKGLGLGPSPYFNWVVKSKF